MDLFAMHLYPNDASKDTPDTKVVWPNVSFATLDRMQQAMWDAFHGTGQPTFEPGTTLLHSGLEPPPPVKWKVDEIGWQTDILDLYKGFYTGKESIKPTAEADQAAYYAAMVRKALCNSLIAELLYFHLIDESDLDRFQSGLQRADGSAKPAFDAVRNALAGSCDSVAQGWRHALTPLTAAQKVFANHLGFDFSWQPSEQELADSMIVRIEDASFDPQDPEDRASLSRLFGARSAQASGANGLTVLTQRSGDVPANLEKHIKLRMRLGPGRYVAAVRVRAWATSDRSQLIVSKVVTVPKKKK
jgi:hypothetical protein